MMSEPERFDLSEHKKPERGLIVSRGAAGSITVKCPARFISWETPSPSPPPRQAPKRSTHTRSERKKPCQKGREPLFFNYSERQSAAHAAFEVILMMASRIDNLSPRLYADALLFLFFPPSVVESLMPVT